MTNQQKMRIFLIIVVTAACAWTSASDIVDVALPLVHGHISRAVTFPAAIDGTILVSALTVAARTGVSAKARKWAAFGRYTGFIATVYANALASGIAHATRIDAAIITGTLFMMIPALALITTMELVIHGAQGTPASRAASRSASKPAAPAKLRAV